MNISIALLAIKELCDIRRDGESDSHEDEAENYMINKQIAACYRKLAEFICGESLSVQEKVEDIVVTMLVEFKSLVLFK